VSGVRRRATGVEHPACLRVLSADLGRSPEERASLRVVGVARAPVGAQTPRRRRRTDAQDARKNGALGPARTVDRALRPHAAERNARPRATLPRHVRRAPPRAATMGTVMPRRPWIALALAAAAGTAIAASAPACFFDWDVGSGAVDGGDSAAETGSGGDGGDGGAPVRACAPVPGETSESCECNSAACSTGCPQGGCRFVCKSGSTCTGTCSGGGCTFVCEPGAPRCEFGCAGGNCIFECASDLFCSNSCSGKSCTCNGHACSCTDKCR
jgi:hypothetical protein